MASDAHSWTHAPTGEIFVSIVGPIAPATVEPIGTIIRSP
jgi:hypothetical protein